MAFCCHFELVRTMFPQGWGALVNILLRSHSIQNYISLS